MKTWLVVRHNRVINAIRWDGIAAYDALDDELFPENEKPGVRIGHTLYGGDWVPPPPNVVFPGIFPEEKGMLQVVSHNNMNGHYYTLDIKAKDIYVGAAKRADFNGTVTLPSMQNTRENTLVYLRQPANGPSEVIAKLRSDPNQPDPADCRLISAFGTYNYNDYAENWQTKPMTFRQAGHLVHFHSDANIENMWHLPTVQEGWAPKSISPWVPDGYCDMIGLRVEVGAKAQGSGDYYVQANIASQNNGQGSKEVKGRSPLVGNNKYIIDLIEVMLAENKIYCCGNNAIVAILCYGYRLNS